MAEFKHRKIYAVNGSPFRALFVSRMHPKKGVLELVESWACLRQSNNPNNRTIEHWSCELVYTMNGDEERAYEARVKQRVHELGLDDQFVFTGPLDDEKKWEAYARANLFVLPTYSENFGIVVAEALWAGLPVITTKGTPWSDLVSHACGWWIDLPSADAEVKGQGRVWKALDDALGRATSTSDIDLRRLGQNGRKLVEEHYTWSAVCEKMVRGYVKVIGG